MEPINAATTVEGARGATRRPARAAAPPSVRRDYLIMKRAVDLVVIVVALPFVLVLLALIAIAIRIDSPGKVVFTQVRTGQHGRRFRMFKFRTMVQNAEELKASLQHLNVLPLPDFKIINDPRITRFGRFLRKTSLDELPQVLNVLKGEMTLVGPRPTSFAAESYDLWHTRRLEVRPGITGLWQVKGRNETTFDERLRLDSQYIRRMSLWFDAKIVWWTIASVVRRTGA
jgi:lipopolysaccharide/colanic/teichoic acid biosynthesis glycosyltransferase